MFWVSDVVMPAISRNAGDAKTLMCDTMNKLITKQVGEEIHMCFKDGLIVWRRVV